MIGLVDPYIQIINLLTLKNSWFPKILEENFFYWWIQVLEPLGEKIFEVLSNIYISKNWGTSFKAPGPSPLLQAPDQGSPAHSPFLQ